VRPEKRWPTVASMGKKMLIYNLANDALFLAACHEPRRKQCASHLLSNSNDGHVIRRAALAGLGVLIHTALYLGRAIS